MKAESAEGPPGDSHEEIYMGSGKEGGPGMDKFKMDP